MLPTQLSKRIPKYANFCSRSSYVDFFMLSFVITYRVFI